MVANKGKGPAPSKKPPTSSAKVVEDKSTPVVAFNANAATTPVETAQGSMGFVEALFDQSVLMHKCLSSQQGLSGGCNFATAEGDDGNHPRDGIHQEGEARNTTSSPLSPTEVDEGTRSSPGTAVGVGRQHPPMHVQGRPEWVRARETTPRSLPPSKPEGVWRTKKRRRPWKRQRSHSNSAVRTRVITNYVFSHASVHITKRALTINVVHYIKTSPPILYGNIIKRPFNPLEPHV